MALNADLKRHVEEDGVHFVLIILGQLDPVLALLRRKVGRVDIVHGALGDEPGFQHGAEVGKYEVLKTLLAHVIEKQRSHHVAGERHHVVALEPRTLAGTRQTDRKYDHAFGGTRRHCGNRRRFRHGC